MNVYILTSNAYTHVVGGFARLFNQYWGENQSVIVFGYDKTPLRLPSNFSFQTLGRQDDVTWSGGALRMLDVIEDDPFILMLEDYYLYRPVNILRVQALYELMADTPTISKIDLTDDRAKLDYSLYNPAKSADLIRSDDNTLFQTSLQAAIWRKSFMREYLRADESPWQFEKAGTKRVISDRRKDLSVGDVLGCLNPPVWYINAIGGEGGHPHIWARNRMPDWMWSMLSAEGLV